VGTGVMRLDVLVWCPKADELHSTVSPFVIRKETEERPAYVECPICGHKWELDE